MTKVFLDANVLIEAGKPPGGPVLARGKDLVDAELITVLATDVTCAEVAKKHSENDYREKRGQYPFSRNCSVQGGFARLSHSSLIKQSSTCPSARAAFGRAIAKRRDELDLSQEELAFRAEMHRSYLGDVECGKRNLSLKNILKICRALKVSARDIFDLADL